MHRITNSTEISSSSTQRMQVGDIGILGDGTFKGSHIMKTYNNFVLLENPVTTWDLSCELLLSQILPKGTEINIVVGGG